MATGHEGQSGVANKCPNDMSWSENLRRGMLALLVHPFAPFYEPKFNYQCLMSRQTYCCENQTDPTGKPHDGHPAHNGTSPVLASNRPPPRGEPTTGYPEMLRDHFVTLFGRKNSSDLMRMARGPVDASKQSWLSKLYPSQHVDHKNWLMISQLAVCTVALAFFLAQDIKYALSYLKTRRAGR